MAAAVAFWNAVDAAGLPVDVAAHCEYGRYFDMSGDTDTMRARSLQFCRVRGVVWITSMDNVTDNSFRNGVARTRL